MTSFDSVAVVGLGLVGGSVARDLAARGVRVSAYDADATHLAAAVRTNVIRSVLDDSLSGVRDADVVIIATPVDAAIGVLRRVAAYARRARLIMDVGSTKTKIVETAQSLGLGDRFIGAHPMAGDHRSGWHASRAGLFIDAPVYLCAPRDATADSILLARKFWLELGARPERMSAEQHDLKLAWTSHLPHMVSTALALALARIGVSRNYLGPGGRDVTRLAGSSPEMWTAIALENAEAIEGALRQTEREIATLRDTLKRADQEDLRARMEAARTWWEEGEAGRGKTEEGGGGEGNAGMGGKSENGANEL
jgi:prephenate dehydrogenase/cyclohexadieny/prephenate dehydrogenase